MGQAYFSKSKIIEKYACPIFVERVIKLPFKVKRPILACGADMKGAFAIAHDREAVLIDGFGDLGDIDNLTKYEKAVKAREKRLGVRARIVVCDLHPEYFSTLFAERLTLNDKRRTLYKAQHHESHIASAITDNSLSGNVMGAAFDGSGFGSDGNVWGGEFFAGSLKRFRRVAHFAYIPMPGGDMAVKEPWRMAASCLYRVFGKRILKSKADFINNLQKRGQTPFFVIMDKGINSPLTSSAGRLFDAAGSLILRKGFVKKEAELPIELERIVDKKCDESYEFDLGRQNDALIIDPSRIIKGVVNDLSRKRDGSIISAKFHNAMADVILKVFSSIRKKYGINRVVLSGGVFQNRILTTRAEGLLKGSDFRVYMHSRVSTNDSGIPIGQIAIANARLRVEA